MLLEKLAYSEVHRPPAKNPKEAVGGLGARAGAYVRIWGDHIEKCSKKSVDCVKKWRVCRLNNPKKWHHRNRSLILISIDFLWFLFDDVMGILLFSEVRGTPINLFIEIMSKSYTSKPVFSEKSKLRNWIKIHNELVQQPDKHSCAWTRYLYKLMFVKFRK